MAKPDKKSVDTQVAEEKVLTDKQTKNKQEKKSKKTKKANDAPKKNIAKESVAELKKVTWPTFGKVVKQTLVVLSVTFVFLLVVIGIDQLLFLLYNLLTKKM